MTMKKTLHTLSVFLIPVFFVLALFAIPSFAANYALEIIQPRAGLNTLNRFYKAYPGLEYNVHLAVIGGLYPYQYSLTAAPSGMTIDAKTGVISWPNPTTSGSPYTVTARVVDSESTVQTVTWTITVTTSGFRFIDAVNGKSVADGGTGTISNPWKSMKDMYEGNDYASKTKFSYAGEFLYWRNGTYIVDSYVEDSGLRTPFVNDGKPQVWLAYPGESPLLDLHNGSIEFYSGGNNVYIDGLTLTPNGNSRQMGIVLSGQRQNVTVRRTHCYGITAGYQGGNNACFFITASNTSGLYYAFLDNTWHDVNAGYGLLGYSADKLLVEGNTLYNIGQTSDSHPISPKEGTSMWFIRNNYFYKNGFNSINVQYHGGRGGLSGDMEISYNRVVSGGGKVRINPGTYSTGYPIYIFRNTFVGNVDITKVTSTNGAFYFYNNVIVNDSSYPNKVQPISIDDPSRFIVSDNLTGNTSAGIVDSNGNLTPTYSSYLGTHGYQIGNQPSEQLLQAPKNLIIK